MSVSSFRRDKSKPLPRDLELLETIFSRYYEEYSSYGDGALGGKRKSRESKVYVPIDVAAIAGDLGAEPDIVFGRLYYHLQRKHGYEDEDGAKVPFFTLGVGNTDRHCVHFPYMASVLAELRDETTKYRVATWTAVISLAVSLGALIVAIVKG